MTFQNPDTTFENQWGEPPVTVMAPLTGAVVLVSSQQRVLYVLPAGGLAALTMRMPRSPPRNMFVEIGFGQAVTTLTLQDGAGVAIPGAATTGAAGTSMVLRYIHNPVTNTDAWVKWR